MKNVKLPTQCLYQQDYYLWIKKTANLLRENKLNELDIENLIEEIEDMGRSEKRALESNLVVVLLHLLKWVYPPSMRTGSWQASILEHRRRIKKALKDSPSLKKYLQEVFVECYDNAREQASAETGLSLDTFPVKSPFSSDNVLNHDYFNLK